MNEIILHENQFNFMEINFPLNPKTQIFSIQILDWHWKTILHFTILFGLTKRDSTLEKQ